MHKQRKNWLEKTMKTVEISWIYILWNLYLNSVFLRLEIAKTFHDTKIFPVPGDGHCLIYSLEITLMDSEKAQFETSCNVLKQSNQYGIPEEHKWIYHLPC